MSVSITLSLLLRNHLQLRDVTKKSEKTEPLLSCVEVDKLVDLICTKPTLTNTLNYI